MGERIKVHNHIMLLSCIYIGHFCTGLVLTVICKPWVAITLVAMRSRTRNVWSERLLENRWRKTPHPSRKANKLLQSTGGKKRRLGRISVSTLPHLLRPHPDFPVTVRRQPRPSQKPLSERFLVSHSEREVTNKSSVRTCSKSSKDQGSH